MTQLFRRRCAITVNDLRFNSDSVDSFRMTFRVERSSESNANTAEAQIFNLSQTSQGRIAVDKPQFVIEAGYLDTVGTLFKGTAVSVSSSPQKPNIITEIKAADGLNEGRARVTGALAPGAELQQAIRLIAKSINVGAKKAIERAKQGDFDGSVKVFFNGLTLSGSAKRELDKLAESHGFEWSIQDGELEILLPGETIEETAVVVSPTTGLIGSPVRVLEEKKTNGDTTTKVTGKKPTIIVIRGKSLLQAGIRPNRRIDIRSEPVTGLFKIRKVTHVGDTHGAEWSSEFEAVEL